MKKTKGFTLIELLVVIAIIGILSSIVLSSLNSARAKGANAGIKQNMNSLRAQAEVYYDTSPTGYTGVCSDAQILKIRAATNTASGGSTTCNSTLTAWAVSSPLKVAEGTSNYWCVDNGGVARGHASALGSATACP